MRTVHSFCPSFGLHGRVVTEAKWLASVNPQFLLAVLEPWAADEAITERQLRLFACACTRRWWSGLTDTQRRDVELGERFADGEVAEDVIRERRGELFEARVRGESDDPPLAEWCFAEVIDGGADDLRYAILRAMDLQLPPSERTAQAAFLRDIVGNPFHPVKLPKKWRTEHTVGIAGKMYDDRDFRAMPILADALEEAGCDNHDVLAHCREPGIHVRGCWVVDLVLGKSAGRT